ncbi:MAG TPA: hypothetical protein VGM27_15815 [Acidobacteriaceae bacterium]
MKTTSFRTLEAAYVPAAVLVAILLVDLSFASAAFPDMTLEGDIRDTQNHTYLEVPFVVPAGVERLTYRSTFARRVESDGKRHWIRADILDGDGQLQLLGNPIYLNAEKF